MVHRDGDLEGLSVRVIASCGPVDGSQLESGFMDAGLRHTGIKAIGLGSELLGTRLGHSTNLFGKY